MTGNEMDWISKILNTSSKKDLNGLHLNYDEPFWEVEGKTNLLPDESILYFEGGYPNDKLLDFLDTHSIPEQVHIAVGTLWPKPKNYHIPAILENITALGKLTEKCAAPELAVHFHVYHEDKVLLEWHDAFDIPMLLSGSLDENKVKEFVDALSMQIQEGTK